MMDQLCQYEKLPLIIRNLLAVLEMNKLRQILLERELKVLWRTAIAVKLDVTYFVPVFKIGDFLKARCEVTILFADMHAHLNMNVAPDQLKIRVKYHEEMIKAMLESIGAPQEKLKFIKETECQLSSVHSLDKYSLSSMVTEHIGGTVAAEVEEQVENPMLSDLMYPGIQDLDGERLIPDSQFGEDYRREIFNLAEKVTVLFADMHAHLNMKVPLEQLEERVRYHEEIINSLLETMGVPQERLMFMKETDYQLRRENSLSGMVAEHDVKKDAAEVEEQMEDPLLSELTYPGILALDEEHLEVDAHFAELDEGDIFTLAEKYMSFRSMGYAKHIHLINPLVSGQTGFSPEQLQDSRIDLLDSRKDVEKKLKKAFWEQGENNGVLSLVKYVFFSLPGEFSIKRVSRCGGDKVYTAFEEVEKDFADKVINSDELRASLEAALNQLLEPIRRKFKSPELSQLVHRA